jgi:predicted RecB family endonuclease
MLQIFLGVCAAIVVMTGFLRWANRTLESRIVKEIKESTYQIQPNSNGGKSLSDLHSKVDLLMRDTGILKTSMLRLETKVEVLEEDVEALK